ncbi:hypothetical protein SAY86_002173 [Trapa natans]|uniref:Uncharacterized protein n=1 Tax=Trapa natans TaxID=22666 RepID=A0AAN7LIR1_TRANT|nr:hypothetical protein SAY86_002173 [Trapa natans]
MIGGWNTLVTLVCRENFDVEIIVEKILLSCDPGKKLEDCRVDELRKKIEGKKYLLEMVQKAARY